MSYVLGKVPLGGPDPKPATPPAAGMEWVLDPSRGMWTQAPIPAAPAPKTSLEAKVHRDLALPMAVLSALGGAASGHILGKTVDSPKLGAVVGGLIAGLYVLTATKA